MIVRPVASTDKEALRSFRCSNGESYANSVETWINRKLCGWAMHSVGNEALVVEGDHGEVIAVCAFEPGEDEDGWFVRLVAVALEQQGQKWARKLLSTTLAELRRRTPDGYAYWKVDRDNVASHALSLGVHAEPTDTPPSSELIVYIVSFLP